MAHLLPGDLQIGRRYRVIGSDCCFNATFEATLVSVEPDPDWDQQGKTTWDNGVEIEGHSVRFEALE